MTKKEIFKKMGIEPFMVFRTKQPFDESYYYIRTGTPYRAGHIYYVVTNVIQEVSREVAYFVSQYRGVMEAPSVKCRQRQWIENVLLKEYDMVYQGKTLSDAISFCENVADQERIGE